MATGMPTGWDVWTPQQIAPFLASGQELIAAVTGPGGPAPSIRGDGLNPIGGSGGGAGGIGTAGTGAATTSGGVGTQGQQDAFAYLKDILNRFDLGSLADWAWSQLLNNRSSTQIALDLMERPEFKQRFPAIEQRKQAGLPAISPAEYVAYENQAIQMMRAAGFPQGMYDQHDDLTRFIAADVSLAELSQRTSLYQQAAYQVPQETRDQLRELYGVNEGDIAAYFADPGRALPILQQKEMAASIAGQAQRQQFGQLSMSEAERLAGLGVTEQGAAEGFGVVNQSRELFTTLPGERDAATRQDALGLIAGDAQAAANVERQARRRRATFAGGGGFATSQQGVSGLGSAAT